MVGYREGKIYAFLHSPWKFTLFIDADTRFCKPVNDILFTAFRLMRGSDIAGVWPAWALKGKVLNGGVVFYHRNERTRLLLQAWLRAYRQALRMAGDATQCRNLGKLRDGCNVSKYGVERVLVQDQGPLASAISKTQKQAGLRVFRLGVEWNYKQSILRGHLRGFVASSALNSLPCCSNSSVIIHHKCNDTAAGWRR